jgi:glutathione S-transferase
MRSGAGGVTGQLEAGPYILGAEFCAADVLWGTALQWMTAFGLVPETPAVKAYVERIATRPASVRMKQEDAVLAAGQKPS